MKLRVGAAPQYLRGVELAFVLLDEAIVMYRILVLAKPEGATSELVTTLARNGFDVFFVDSGDAALAELARRHVDLLLLDLDLRVLDVARIVRSAYPSTRVILTGRVSLTERQLERLDCGAVAFLPKPFELRGVSSFLEEHLTTPHSRRLWHAEQPSSYAL